MNIEEELKDLGFHPYEIDILKELKENKLRAKQLSDEADVPMSRIYDFLSNLIERGLVKNTFSTPSYYYTEDLESKILNYLDNDFLDLAEDQNKMLEPLETEKMEVKAINSSSQFGKIVRRERVEEDPEFIKKIRRDITYPFFFFPEGPRESIPLRAKVFSTPEDYYTDEVIEEKHKIYGNQKEGYSTIRSQVLISKFSIDYFFNKIKKYFTDERALEKLNNIKEELENYPLLELNISKERFPYHLMITDRAMILTIKEEKENKKNLVGTYIKGGELVKKYPKVFDAKFTKTKSFNEYYEELKTDIKTKERLIE